MNIKKITKEEQEKNLKEKISNKFIPKRKPSFSEWLMFDKKAFQITFLMGILGGVLVMLSLFSLSIIFDFGIFLQLLFGGLLSFQLWNAYKALKNQKHLDMNINDMIYKGKHKSQNYDNKRASPA